MWSAMIADHSMQKGAYLFRFDAVFYLHIVPSAAAHFNKAPLDSAIVVCGQRKRAKRFSELSASIRVFINAVGEAGLPAACVPAVSFDAQLKGDDVAAHVVVRQQGMGRYGVYVHIQHYV
jgi:hypothetical protein